MRTMSMLLLVAAAALAVGACKPKPKPAPPRPPQPLTFSQTTPDATVKLAIAPAVATWPDLRAKLFEDGVAELKKDLETAKEDRAHIADEGFPNPAYEHELAWNLSASNLRLVSLKGTWSSFTGGAHPNNGFHTLLWDTNTGSEIRTAELFNPAGPADAAIDQALCDAVKQARVAKGVEPDSDPSTWPCPKWRESDLVLVPSTTPGKFGGVDFVFDPYAIGSYAEGPYEAVVPYAAIKGALAPAYAGEFAGAPAKR